MMHRFNPYKVKLPLIAYDILIILVTSALLLIAYRGGLNLDFIGCLTRTALFAFVVLGVRILCDVYRQVWRYGGIQSYLRMIFADGAAFVVFFHLQLLIWGHDSLRFDRCLSMACVNVLGAVSMRMLYRYCYKYSSEDSKRATLLKKLLRLFAGYEKETAIAHNQKIRVGIIGAGRVGTALAEELLGNPNAIYTPVCFIDTSTEKVGKNILGIKVISGTKTVQDALRDDGVQELVFAIPKMPQMKKQKLYDYYRNLGYKIKTYDYPAMQSSEDGGKRLLREFDIEDLLFRKQIKINSEDTARFYAGKTILVTGGGGSIGSELCRQLARFKPDRIVVLDIAENGAYDVQQELRLTYMGTLNVNVEICSVNNEKALDRVFAEYKPDIVVMAAAHKHVPLMEKNCIEAIENNVFGTLCTVKTAVRHKAERVIMVSTDKAVNPTNVMGATKRMCEMIVHSYASRGYETTFSITRFGNVLGSAGSVIPLFRRQIAKGGPVTITDKRIIRYFMTIPEASQLVLESGAMAHNGELFVLDMGKPIRILELAENMIRLSGFEPYTDIGILETGLRPGEKLYEELLVKSDSLTKTQNDLIFTEYDEAVSEEKLTDMLETLATACATNDDSAAKQALRSVVPTFKTPEEVNKAV